VAQSLQLPLDVIVPRKIGAPHNPELAIGAIAGNGMILDHPLIQSLGVEKGYLDKVIAQERAEAERRRTLFRKGMPPLILRDWTVLLVDDGIATGSTMLASIAAVKVEKAKKIIVAVPVGPPDTIQRIQIEVDEVVCLLTPESFMAVGQFYSSFPQTTDREVIELLHEY
jgi:putative phosphoribosyl transferase